MNQDLELRDVVSRLREELQAAAEEGADKDIKFKVETIELELKVAVKRTGEGKAGIKFSVFGIGAEAGAGAKLESERVQTIKLKMVPQTKAGGSIAVSDQSSGRPVVPGSGGQKS